MKRAHLKLAGIVGVTLLGSACASEENGTEANDFGTLGENTTSEAAESVRSRLLEVKLLNGNVVEFHEPVPGDILIIEHGSFPNPSMGSEINVKAMTVTEVYRHLRPSEAVPKVLAEAQTRHQKAILAAGNTAQETPNRNVTGRADFDEVAPSDTRSALPAAVYANGIAALTGTIDDSACPWSRVSTHGPCESHDVDWTVQWSYSTGSSWFERHNYHTADTGACSYRGNIVYTYKYRPATSWKTFGSWTLQPGTYKEVWYASGNRFDIKSEVTSADGDGYHHCGWGDEDIFIRDE